MQEGRHDAPVFREATHGTGRTDGGGPGCGTVRSSVCCPDGDDPGSGGLAGRRPQGMGRDHYPGLEAAHRGIVVEFRPSLPAGYDAVIEDKLEAGTVGDLTTCRPFDRSLALHGAGHLADIDDLPGMDCFPVVARSAWQTDDGSTTFCVPVASVLHGFLIGPTCWKGEEGRLALIAGRQTLADEPWIAPGTLARWRPYLGGGGYAAPTCRESRNLFASGRAAIYPAGSWEIAGFNARAGFAMGAFAPQVLTPAMRAMSPTPLIWGSASTPRAPTGQRAAYF